MNPGQIIPLPQHAQFQGQDFVLGASATISYRDSSSKGVAELLAEYLRPATGYAIDLVEGNDATIRLHCDNVDLSDKRGFSDESYEIEISAQGADIAARTPAGLARGIQCFRQCFPIEIFSKEKQDVVWRLPHGKIKDQPRFKWRGMHLDVCRHFFNADQVCRFIELIAIHRFNVCHLHLTEDQGWRIEIKKYPKLTEIGSKRKSTLVGHHNDRPRKYDDIEYGGFFTQDDIRKIVAFAEKRHINVLPEIDLPGHSSAAIAAYPELGNDPSRKIETRCHWGIAQHTLNLETSTLDFVKDVLGEVIEMFPSPYIHVGGDEAPKHEWSESRAAQDRMRELGLNSEDELQSWFIRQLDEFITSKGRRLIGWDEILEGGLSDNATVMSWRGDKGGIEASKQGHDVVMAPNHSTYFDHYQAEPTDQEPLAIGGHTNLEKVYQYEPIPEDMDEKQAEHVLGSQGQLWSEYIPTLEQLDYMAFPRACALSEVIWSKEKNFEDFLDRLDTHLQRLNLLDVNYKGRQTPSL